jgi:hypothetical protein
MADTDTQYLVRGAMLICDKGSHPRRLNLPESHGSYVCSNPWMIESDCGEENVKFFGVCSSETPPEGAKVQRFEGYQPKGSEGTVDPVEGPRCTPDILDKWKNCHGEVLTMDSYLVCNCGGLITPVTSGQEYQD